ncbi:MAG: hypothetical protein AB1505_01915 [Candidatus Latescibacterota bacterium]
MRHLLGIDWRLGPDYPMGIQDSAVGFASGRLVSAGGFTRHPRDVLRQHPDAFDGEPSGFTRLTFALNLADEGSGWQRLPDVPGPARQGAAVAVVDDALYLMGGMSYAAPHTYRETFRLRCQAGQWAWEELPGARLPWPAYGAGASTAVVGPRIYLTATADFFAPPGVEDPDLHSEAGREGSPVGRALLMLDTRCVDRGWQRLPDCPGLPLCDAGVAAAGGRVWRLGGIHAPLHPGDGPHYYNAVDSWVFDPAAETWSRLPDLPPGANRRALTWQDRYILLVAGYRYGWTRLCDGSRAPAHSEEERQRDWTSFFEDTVLVFDTATSELGTADPLLERTSYPSSAVVGDTVYCLGGEGGPRLWHPATLHIGTVRGPSPAADP